jgi:uncharacterized membrane protein
MADTKTREVEDALEEGKERVTGNGNGGVGKKILIPAAAGLGTLAATYAARKAPELLNDRLKPKIEEAGTEEAAKIGKGAAQKLTKDAGPLGAVAGKLAGGGGGSKQKKTRRLPIQRWTDVAVPIDEAYQAWTNFEEYPKFMHRVLSVEKPERDLVKWEEKIWFSRRQWEGQITERRKNDRIAWKTKSGVSHKGIVSFHKLDTNLTRVMVDMDFEPTGMIEKMASGLRFVKRAVQADLARFKAYVEMDDARGLEYDAKKNGKDDQKKDAKKDAKDAKAERSDNGSDNDSDDEPAKRRSSS